MNVNQVFNYHPEAQGVRIHVKTTSLFELLYSLSISREESFADFTVLRVISENFILEIFRPPFSLIHFGSACKSSKILFLQHCSTPKKLPFEIFRLTLPDPLAARCLSYQSINKHFPKSRVWPCETKLASA